METASLVLAGLALLSGIVAVARWYKASKVMVMPMEDINGELKPLSILRTPEWIYAVYQGIEKSGDLNRNAALWTAASVMLSAAGSAFGAFAK
jgi:hypothetical protein